MKQKKPKNKGSFADQLKQLFGEPKKPKLSEQPKAMAESKK